VAEKNFRKKRRCPKAGPSPGHGLPRNARVTETPKKRKYKLKKKEKGPRHQHIQFRGIPVSSEVPRRGEPNRAIARKRKGKKKKWKPRVKLKTKTEMSSRLLPCFLGRS